MTTKMNIDPSAERIPSGALVHLDDGTSALAYYDGDDTYRTIQMNLATRGDRVDTGWRREQLLVVDARDDRRPGR
jgi:hypothetical protein